MSAKKDVTMADVRSMLWRDMVGVREGTVEIKVAEMTNKQATTLCKAVAIEVRAMEIQQRLGTKAKALGEMVVATEGE